MLSHNLCPGGRCKAQLPGLWLLANRQVGVWPGSILCYKPRAMRLITIKHLHHPLLAIIPMRKRSVIPATACWKCSEELFRTRRRTLHAIVRSPLPSRWICSIFPKSSRRSWKESAISGTWAVFTRQTKIAAANILSISTGPLTRTSNLNLRTQRRRSGLRIKKLQRPRKPRRPGRFRV